MLHSPAPDTCLMFLIRHGATEANTARPPRLQGRGVNLSLSQEGCRQAEQTATFLASEPLAAIYSSPLKRAAETAGHIAAKRQLSVESIAELVEVDVGNWEGRSWAEIGETELAAYQLFLADPGSHGYSGGENMQQVQDRVTPALDHVLRQNLGRVIAVVGHNVVNRAYLSGVLGLPIAKSRNLIQDNCGINLLTHRAGETKLITCNAVAHLRQ